jgi:hypothetical protein
MHMCSADHPYQQRRVLSCKLAKSSFRALHPITVHCTVLCVVLRGQCRSKTAPHLFILSCDSTTDYSTGATSITTSALCEAQSVWEFDAWMSVIDPHKCNRSGIVPSSSDEQIADIELQERPNRYHTQ